MGKVKVGLYCYLIADILTKVLQRCSLSFAQTSEFAKKNSKIISSETIRVMKLKLCRNGHNIN